MGAHREVTEENPSEIVGSGKARKVGKKRAPASKQVRSEPQQTTKGEDQRVDRREKLKWVG